MQKRLIEQDLTLTDISGASAREKNIRHGHPTPRHVRWARPMSLVSATRCATRAIDQRKLKAESVVVDTVDPTVTITPEKPEAEKRYRRVRLVTADVPAGRIADVNRGVLAPVKTAFGEFSFTLTLEVADEEGIAASTLENTVKETIRQIGARVVEEDLE